MSDEYLSLTGTDPVVTRPTFLVGNAFSVAWSTLTSNLLSFLTMATIAYLPVIVLTVLLCDLNKLAAKMQQFDARTMIHFFALYLATIVAGYLTTAFVTVGVFRFLRGRRSSLGETIV